MSVISERVRTALYTALNVAGVTAVAQGGIYFEQAPPSAFMPFLIFDRLAPGQPVRAFKQTLIAEDDLWIIKAYADTDSGTSSPREQIEVILQAAETALGTTLTLSSGQTWLVERFADISLPSEDVNDRKIYAGAFSLRVVATP